MKKWVFFVVVLAICLVVSGYFISIYKVAQPPSCQEITLIHFEPIIRAFKTYCYWLSALVGIWLGIYIFKRVELAVIKGKAHPRRQILPAILLTWLFILVITWVFYLLGQQKTWLSLDATTCEKFAIFSPELAKILSIFGQLGLSFYSAHSFDLLICLAVIFTLSYLLTLFIFKRMQQ